MSIAHRVPLIYVLLPLLFGIVTAYYLPLPINGHLPILSFSLLLASLAGFWIYRRNKKQLYWKISYSISFGLACWAYVSLWYPGTRIIDLPPREARLQFQVMELLTFEEDLDYCSGYGVIVEAPAHLKLTEKKKLFFRVKTAPALLRGQVITAMGVLSPITYKAEHPFEQFLYKKGISFSFSRGSVITFHNQPSIFIQFYRNFYKRMNQLLSLGATDITKPYAAIYKAMLLGNKRELPEAHRILFIQTGTAHLFAISGLHIGVIYFSLQVLMRFLRLSLLQSGLASLLILYVYLNAIECPLSAIRALGMLAWFYAASFIGRKPLSLVALVNTATICLCLCPLDFWEISFQLSYFVVLFLLLYGVPASKLSKMHLRPYSLIPSETLSLFQKMTLKGFTAGSDLFWISLAAGVASSPLCILHFQNFTPFSVAINMCLVPLGTLVITIGVVSLLFGFLKFNFITILCNYAAYLI
jgi:competence protein ComEC